jgi:hypothetical protein
VIALARFLVLLILALPLAPARGETMIEMTLEEKVRASDLVVHGRVVEVSSRWSEGKGSMVWTDYVVDIMDVLHGDAEGDRVVVTQQGGILEGVALEVGSNPELIEGDEVVLFLAEGDFLSEQERGGDRTAYTIVGVAQGAYYVVAREGENVAVRDYGRLAIVPRELAPTESPPSFGSAFEGELERLRAAVERNPEDRDLARRLAQAERLLGAASPPPGRKPAEGAAERRLDLGAKPIPAEQAIEQGEVEGDAPPGLRQREAASAKALQEQLQRFERLVEPVPLQELKERIRDVSRQITE